MATGAFVIGTSAVGGPNLLGGLPVADQGWPGVESLGFPYKQRAPMPMIAGPREDRIMSMQGRQKG